MILTTDSGGPDQTAPVHSESDLGHCCLGMPGRHVWLGTVHITVNAWFPNTNYTFDIQSMWGFIVFAFPFILLFVSLFICVFVL